MDTFFLTTQHLWNELDPSITVNNNSVKFGTSRKAAWFNLFVHIQVSSLATLGWMKSPVRLFCGLHNAEAYAQRSEWCYAQKSNFFFGFMRHWAASIKINGAHLQRCIQCFFLRPWCSIHHRLQTNFVIQLGLTRLSQRLLQTYLGCQTI